MKVYILFKVKDMSQKKKQYIIDSLHTSEDAMRMRESRLHKGETSRPYHIVHTKGFSGLTLRKDTYSSQYQKTYYIVKSLKGLVKIQETKKKIKEVPLL